MTRGGKRPGAGRPELPPDQRRKKKTMKFPPQVCEYLESLDNATGTVEWLIVRSDGFKEWKSR